MNLKGIALLLFAVQAPPAAQSSTASIEGIVVESGTKTALPRTTLELRSLQGALVRYPAFSSTEGRFAFQNVAPGRYALSAFHTGYLRVEYGQRGPNGNAVVLAVAPGQHIADVRMSLRPSSAISGRVHDRAGEPIVNAQMHAWRISYAEGWRVSIPVESEMTDDRGEFRLFGLPPGLYCISAQPEPRTYVKSPAYASLPPAVPGAFVLASTGGSTGGTADPANTLRSPGADWTPVYYGGTTDEFTAAQIDLRAGDDLRNVDMVVDRIPLVSITGAAVDARTGQPVPASVAVTPLIAGLPFTTVTSVPVFLMAGKLMDPPPSALRARENGIFDSPTIAGGTYLLTAIADREGRRLAGQTVVDIRSGSTVTAKISLSLAAEISGRIVIEGLPPGAVDAGMAALRVGLKSVITPIADVPPAIPSESGAFTMRNVAPGEYLLDVAPLSGFSAPDAAAGLTPPIAKRAYVKSAHLGNIDVLNDGLRLVNAPEGQLELVIGGNPGGAGGTVVDENRAALPDITVVLLPDESHRNRIDLYRSAVTDGSGHFRFDGVPPGRYKLFAWEDVEKNAWRNPGFMQIHEDRGATVTVSEGTDQSMELKVIPF